MSKIVAMAFGGQQDEVVITDPEQFNRMLRG